jgi:hypothetical protein
MEEHETSSSSVQISSTSFSECSGPLPGGFVVTSWPAAESNVCGSTRSQPFRTEELKFGRCSFVLASISRTSLEAAHVRICLILVIVYLSE